ncbi:MAG: hypothetical protein GXP32_00675 [Kiritimatiellaeota bacterium]|nr:hypothetical protein [Kiritimatiellota bacterium]
MYSNVYNDIYPPTLKILKKEGFLENDEIYLWANPENGGKFPFIYCAGLTEASSVDFILAAAPIALNGYREALYVDGHVKRIPEKEFKRQAVAQKWNLTALWSDKKIPKEKARLIEKLVKQLGSDEFALRRNAKKQLISMGFEAFSILQKHVKDPDPEIKISVKEILNAH